MWVTVRRVMAGIALVALLAPTAACGGSHTVGPPPGTTPAVETAGGTADAAPSALGALPGAALDDPALVALVTEIAADVGADAVFSTVALALDRGYSTSQLAEGVATARLAADGTIGGTEPANEPYNLLDPDSATTSFYRTAAEGVAIDRLATEVAPVHDDFDWRTDLDAGLQDNLVLAGTLVTLVDMGYDFDQIVEGVIFGELDVRYGTERTYYTTGPPDIHAFGCLTLADATGSVIVPKHLRTFQDSAVPRSAECSRLAHDGGLLTAEQARAQVLDARAPSAAPTAGSQVPPPVASTGGASYELTVVLDVVDDGGIARYDYTGAFAVDAAGAVAGAGTVTGALSGTCQSPTAEGTVLGPYSYTTEGTFTIGGRVAGDTLELELIDPNASFTSQQGDRSILCVDLTADAALAFASLPLGGEALGLGPMVVPVAGGSTIIDGGDGIVFDVAVVPR